ncbi:hypothetical protein GVAV_000526 [Gurleya vavrai]
MASDNQKNSSECDTCGSQISMSSPCSTCARDSTEKENLNKKQKNEMISLHDDATRRGFVNLTNYSCRNNHDDTEKSFCVKEDEDVCRFVYVDGDSNYKRKSNSKESGDMTILEQKKGSFVFEKEINDKNSEANRNKKNLIDEKVNRNEEDKEANKSDEKETNQNVILNDDKDSKNILLFKNENKESNISEKITKENSEDKGDNNLSQKKLNNTSDSINQKQVDKNQRNENSIDKNISNKSLKKNIEENQKVSFASKDNLNEQNNTKNDSFESFDKNQEKFIEKGSYENVKEDIFFTKESENNIKTDFSTVKPDEKNSDINSNKNDLNKIDEIEDIENKKNDSNQKIPDTEKRPLQSVKPDKNSINQSSNTKEQIKENNSETEKPNLKSSLNISNISVKDKNSGQSNLENKNSCQTTLSKNSDKEILEIKNLDSSDYINKHSNQISSKNLDNGYFAPKHKIVDENQKISNNEKALSTIANTNLSEEEANKNFKVSSLKITSKENDSLKNKNQKVINENSSFDIEIEKENQDPNKKLNENPSCLSSRSQKSRQINLKNSINEKYSNNVSDHKINEEESKLMDSILTNERTNTEKNLTNENYADNKNLQNSTKNENSKNNSYLNLNDDKGNTINNPVTPDNTPIHSMNELVPNSTTDVDVFFINKEDESEFDKLNQNKEENDSLDTEKMIYNILEKEHNENFNKAPLHVNEDKINKEISSSKTPKSSSSYKGTAPKYSSCLLCAPLRTQPLENLICKRCKLRKQQNDLNEEFYPLEYVAKESPKIVGAQNIMNLGKINQSTGQVEEQEEEINEHYPLNLELRRSRNLNEAENESEETGEQDGIKRGKVKKLIGFFESLNKKR